MKLRVIFKATTKSDAQAVCDKLTNLGIESVMDSSGNHFRVLVEDDIILPNIFG